MRKLRKVYLSMKGQHGENRNGQHLGTVENPSTSGGPQAMEVDRVQEKGRGWKGRDHGKGKGRKDQERLWQNVWSIWSHASWERI